MDVDVLDPYRPRLIVWELAPQDGTGSRDENTAPFSTHECLVTIDSIARTSKPIVVFTGRSILRREDLFSIVEYGAALGLKIIIEARPHELSDDILRKYSVFGSRIFRLLVDGCIVEDMDTRYRQSREFVELEKAVERLRERGFEIHLSVAIANPNVRELAFHHDYAVKRVAAGFYCHLCFEDGEDDPSAGAENSSIGQLIDAIAQMKAFSPGNMYFSPQCIRYVHRHEDPTDQGNEDVSPPPEETPEWDHRCLGGKTFAYINAAGTVQLCAGIGLSCGDLRVEKYDFKRIWDRAELFQSIRNDEWSCTETRSRLLKTSNSKTNEKRT